MRKSVYWSQQEDQLITNNYLLIRSKKWKAIANILKQHGFQKKQTECRQRFINHLAPNLDKNNEISRDQLERLYDKYEQYGPKWTLIQTFLPTKSQVQLKNVFYGTIRCFVKKIIKFFTKKTAVFVNKLDTFTLQNIYSGKKSFKGLIFLKQDIKTMNFKFQEQRCLELISQKQSNYRVLFNLFLQLKQAKSSKYYRYFRRKWMDKRENNIKKDIIRPIKTQSQGMQQFQVMSGEVQNQKIKKTAEKTANSVLIQQIESYQRSPFINNDPQMQNNHFIEPYYFPQIAEYNPWLYPFNRNMYNRDNTYWNLYNYMNANPSCYFSHSS